MTFSPPSPSSQVQGNDDGEDVMGQLCSTFVEEVGLGNRLSGREVA